MITSARQKVSKCTKIVVQGDPAVSAKLLQTMPCDPVMVLKSLKKWLRECEPQTQVNNTEHITYIYHIVS